MKPFGTIVLAVVAALTLLLLFADLHIAYTSDKTDSQQTMVRNTSNPAPQGHKLTVYLIGDLTLTNQLKKQLPRAIQAKDLAFGEVLFLNKMPADSNENPLLAILLAKDGGLWTPFFATSHVEATILYAQGSPVDRDHLFTPDSGGVSAASTVVSCMGQCSEGRRILKLDTLSRGLVSLPYIRAYVAGKVAEEAATLVAEGVSEHLNPAKWSDRAGTLAREKLQQEGTFSYFQRLNGCRGGIVVVGRNTGAEWSLMYYDASRDAITEMLTRSEAQAKLPGVQLRDPPGLGPGKNGLSIYVGETNFILVPVGTCSLSGWQIKSP